MPARIGTDEICDSVGLTRFLTRLRFRFDPFPFPEWPLIPEMVDGLQCRKQIT